MISCTVEIFDRDSVHWLQITGSLFGPFRSQDEAIDAIPSALRTLD